MNSAEEMITTSAERSFCSVCCVWRPVAVQANRAAQAKPRPQPRGSEVITIQNLAFSPSTLPAEVGDTVTVTNKDSINHTFTADNRSFDTGAFSSGSKTVKLSYAGTIPYHCKIHTFMHGTLQVSS